MNMLYDEVEEEQSSEECSTGIVIPFERTRRITGYLVGTKDRFCNAKASEERDRVKHSVRYLHNDE